MKKILFRTIVVAVSILSLVLIASCATDGSQSGDSDGAYAKADLKLGGLLYDKWAKVRNLETAGNHPLYPALGKKKGGDTFRCKECHGWDYIGKDGRYSKGSHYTGIKGLYDSRTKSPEELYSALTDTDAKHNFSKHLTDSGDIWALVKFIKEGQLDITTALGPDVKAKGSVSRGKTLFDSNCSRCHGEDGNKLDFKGDKNGVQGVGWLANDNPQESLHKIRIGHPGSAMPSMIVERGLSDSETVDILTYSLTL